MREKIASYNRVSDKGMDLIAKVAHMNDLVKALLLEPDQQSLDEITQQAQILEASVVSYQNCLVTAVQEIVKNEDEIPTDIEAVNDGNGFRLG
jgi:ATP-dependent phosphoenolpyruvate carboxykinase